MLPPRTISPRFARRIPCTRAPLDSATWSRVFMLNVIAKKNLTATTLSRAEMMTLLMLEVIVRIVPLTCSLSTAAITEANKTAKMDNVLLQQVIALGIACRRKNEEGMQQQQQLRQHFGIPIGGTLQWTFYMTFFVVFESRRRGTYRTRRRRCQMKKKTISSS
jgi:hypothetical protein